MAREVDYTLYLSPRHTPALVFGDEIKSDSSEPHGSGRGMSHRRKNEAYYQKWEKMHSEWEKLEMELEIAI